MRIRYNDREAEVKSGTTLADFLSENNIAPAGIAVAVNQQVVSRKDWHSHILHDQDSIIIIKATQGG